MSHQRIIIWYRNDLRIHDHEPLHWAIQDKAEIIPLYCFDPRQFSKTCFGFPKTGGFRTQFLLESVADLRSSLQERGSDLILRQGLPEKIIPELVKTLEVDAVYYSKEVTAEEVGVEQVLAKALKPLGTDLEAYWGATLYHLADLPFPIEDLPGVFTQFRKQIEKKGEIRQTFPTPPSLQKLPEISPGQLPTLKELGVEPVQIDERAVLQFQGGETAGLQRLQEYFWERDCLKSYKETRNGLLGADYSSKFSPWLSLGCLSPRLIYDNVEDYETKRVKNNSTYWLVFELLWRDYFRFICLKHGNKVFYKSGLRGLEIDWKENWKQFEQWQTGTTGFPFVDANMRELAATGFMSNRGRQNVASFLTKNLGIDWQMGAEWFESVLIDYDVCSNWGNWNYTAGVGNDARGFRYFNIPKQAQDYDPEGKYVKYWIPELSAVPAGKIHSPWKLQPVEQKRFDLRLGVDYPNPMVDLVKSVKANQAIYEAAL
ncbi:MAG: DASH family cryptochrome [Microcoleaceae cyanobacterium]